MAQPYSGYPIDRIQASPSTSSRSSTRSASNQSTHKYSMRPSSNTASYKPYKSPSSNTPKTCTNTNTNTNTKYRSLTTMAQAKADSNKYMRGTVMVTPQNESTPGWIYCKTTNTMYQLPFNHKKHLIKDQNVLFNTSNKLRGLKLNEARSLMLENKLNINNYKNYFVSESISNNMHHTTLIGLDAIHDKYLTPNSESMHNKDKFILNTFINLRENNEIEFKLFDPKKTNVFPFDKMVNIMERYLNGFVNMNGGTIYCGINDDGRVIGENIFNINSRKILDEIELKICAKLREWKPQQYTQKLIQSIVIDIVDIIKIDDEDNVGFILPNKKIIKAYIETVKDDEGNHVIFASSKENKNAVYVRHLSSLCAYTDCTMQQQIGKRQILKLNMSNAGNNESESDIDFDDDDEKDWIDIDSNKLKNDIKDDSNSYKNTYFDAAFYNQRITSLFQNIHNTFSK